MTKINFENYKLKQKSLLRLHLADLDKGYMSNSWAKRENRIPPDVNAYKRLRAAKTRGKNNEARSAPHAGFLSVAAHGFAPLNKYGAVRLKPTQSAPANDPHGPYIYKAPQKEALKENARATIVNLALSKESRRRGDGILSRISANEAGTQQHQVRYDDGLDSGPEEELRKLATEPTSATPRVRDLESESPEYWRVGL